jgi:DMSO/TMAO reductase YedYZ molybdopterin-dependent catalytic subunit
MTDILHRLILVAALGLSAWAHAHDTPKPAAPAARLTVAGAVQQKLSLSADELRKFPADQILELRLPGRGAGEQSGPSVVKGVRLRALLDAAKIATADHNTVKKLAIIATATDGYTVVFSWNELFNAELGEAVLVLFERDGQPLNAAEGPLALISGKDIRTGPRHVKWLQAIEVRQIAE